MEGLQTAIRGSLNEFTNTAEAALESLHQQINFEDNSSMKVFFTCIRKVRDYCSSFTKKRSKKAKKKEKKLINNLVDAQTELQQDLNDTVKIDVLEEAQMKS